MNSYLDSSLYDILGIDKNSNLDTIKKAYKNLAIKYHPDKNINNKDFCKDNFINITNAYNILSNNFNKIEKEVIYDNSADFKVNKDLNKATSFFKIFMNNENTNNNQIDKLNLDINLEDIYNGCNKKINFNRIISCKYCKGQGTISLEQKQICNMCSGLGINTIIKQEGNILNEINIPCNKCMGFGKISKQGDACKFCNSKGVYKNNDTINLNIEKGYDQNKIILKKKGHFNIDTKNYNDLEIFIKIKEHPVFKVKKNDLIIKHKLSLCNALVDNFIIITHLDNRKIYAKSDNILLKNRIKYIKNEGMPLYNLPGKRGNLIIKIIIKYPESIELSKVKYLKKIIPYNNYNLSDDLEKKILLDN